MCFVLKIGLGGSSGEDDIKTMYANVLKAFAAAQNNAEVTLFPPKDEIFIELAPFSFKVTIQYLVSMCGGKG